MYNAAKFDLRFDAKQTQIVKDCYTKMVILLNELYDEALNKNWDDEPQYVNLEAQISQIVNRLQRIVQNYQYEDNRYE